MKLIENSVRFPKVEKKLGLGIGMDLPWGEDIGFCTTENGDDITPKMKIFFDNYKDEFNYMFFAFQPKNRSVLKAEDYFEAYDRLFNAVPNYKARAFHQTILNMGATEKYEKSSIIEFTNKIIERYGIKWVVEDLGLWSIKGKTVPFPLPPYMTPRGLEACIENINEYQKNLLVPVCIEFPGFTEGTNFFIGDMDGFDYFNTLVQETNSPVTIDIGHILSYQWLIGNTDEKMYTNLSKLPLENCFELHLSGCQIIRGKFRDLHHGILLDEQIDLLKYLLPLCPNLKAITYEDPKYTNDGILIPKSQRNYQRMKEVVKQWQYQ
ncbi:DUF692 family protein [Bacillus clarus]|uniref:DUF692 family protein n=1 Tax=Bacillus clarus TaxID=2338372 RepID=A0A090YSX9_9BACI|nr:DUF692 family multinuclear iron-containing protein [Bacillus clarus]KFN01515.1 hypothetical protein DJ93_254 [Bacillus clarus]RFT62991.1 DUF692 family protein [Bacillus clarus]